MSAKISASADGLKVTIGNAAEDALEIDQTAKTIKGINGYGISPPAQTWQDVTTSRAFGSTYTNNTDQPIQVNASAISASAGVVLIGTVGGVQILGSSTGAGGHRASITFNVPAGANYSATLNGGSGLAWAELR